MSARLGRPQEGLLVEAVGAAAARAGVRAGDRVTAVDGAPAVDVLDLEFAAADGRFSVRVARAGHEFETDVVLRRGEDHGFIMWNGIGVAPRVCDNACTFCFVDQVPAGLRPSLSVKDDDYRLSFLLGTFTTLSNLTREDEARVVRLRLSPLYVSLHAWDDDVRVELMGPCVEDSRERLLRLAGAGIEFHLQVVLCPGVNDGAVLEETLQRLSATAGMLTAGVVPVSLADERRLRRVSAADAAAAVAVVESLQADRERAGRSRFAHAADELYLAAGRVPPAADAPPQYENGIGIVAESLAAARRADVPEGLRVALLGGTLAEGVLREAGRILAERAAAAGRRLIVRPYAVENRTFGPHVTVTGLLGGRDLVRRLGEEPLAAGELLLVPRTFLPTDPGMTIDDLSESELQAACGGRLVFAESLGAALSAAARRRG